MIVSFRPSFTFVPFYFIFFIVFIFWIVGSRDLVLYATKMVVLVKMILWWSSWVR